MRGRLIAVVFAAALLGDHARAEVTVQTYALPQGGGYPHDVAVGSDGIAWYTAQKDGKLGRLNPADGTIELVALGEGSAPHGVIIGPDGAPWVTDGGLNAIVRVDPVSRAVKVWKLPAERGYTNLNTATFDKRGYIWFTGQNGIIGWLNTKSACAIKVCSLAEAVRGSDILMSVFDAPRGRGPYGITTTPSGDIYYASLAGNHIAHIDIRRGDQVTPIDPPTPEQGARRVWSDSRGMIWVSEWKSGQLSRYDPATKSWKSWKAPGDKPQVYAVYVDADDIVWVSEWSANAVLRFDPKTQQFQAFPSDKPNAHVRQMYGRRGEVWAAESGADRLVVFRTK